MINCTTELNHSRGTSILLRNNLDIEMINENNFDDRRIALLNFKYNQYIYTICSIYAPNKIKDKLLFFKKTKEWIQENHSSNSYIILCDDFNTSLNDIRKHDASRNKLKSMIHNMSVIDVYKHSDITQGATYINTKNIAQSSRIDYIFAEKSLYNALQVVTLK